MLKKLVFFFLFPVLLKAQYQDLQFIDYDYEPYIKTVTFHIQGLPLSQPIIELGQNNTLAFAFDDMRPEWKRYTYTLILCNADWTPSDLSYLEYLEGFEENDVRNFNYSFNTITEYTHYWFSIPNEDMRPTKSGNYLLVVYENENEKKPVITRRMVIVEPIAVIQPRVTTPTDVSKYRTHQEIDFVVSHEKFDIRNPRASVSATVIQNGCWPTAITGLPPFYIRSDDRMEFDYQDKVVFPAGREWRQLDLRSVYYPAAGIQNVERFEDEFYVTLEQDIKRAGDPHLTFVDLNGGFVIENRDRQDADLSGEYATVLFALDSPTEYLNADVYIYGKITNWKLKDEFKMAYNNQYHAYVRDLGLKLGYYNYMYVLASPDREQVDFSEIEGNWYETENSYTIIIYYHPFGARYDRAIGALTFSSRN